MDNGHLIDKIPPCICLQCGWLVDNFDIVDIKIVHNLEGEITFVTTTSFWAKYEHVVFLAVDDYIEVVPTMQKLHLSTYTS